MKKLIFLAFSLSSFTCLIGQKTDQDSSVRNGQWIIEVGNGLITSFSGPNSGVNVFFANGLTQTSLGINVGKFIKDDLALKANLSFISFGNVSTKTFMAGGKYYIGGNLPLDLTAGVISGIGISEFVFRGTIGYAIPLADNINVEPGIGVFYSGDTLNSFIQLSFAMFF